MSRAERQLFLLSLLSLFSVIVYLGIVMRPTSFARQISSNLHRLAYSALVEGISSAAPVSNATFTRHNDAPTAAQGLAALPLVLVPQQVLSNMNASAAAANYDVRPSVHPSMSPADVRFMDTSLPTAASASPRLTNLGKSGGERNSSAKSPPAAAVGSRRPAEARTSSTPTTAPPDRLRTDRPSSFRQHRIRPTRNSVHKKFEWSSSEGPPRCLEPNCRDLLSPSDQLALRRCESETLKHIHVPFTKPTCRFVKVLGNLRRAVALNSQEGSGNTWLRGLLEKATGICTGFYGCDYEMRARGFLGEGVKTASILVVKTHVHIPQWFDERRTVMYEGSYGSAVFLIRNPARGVIAEWSRLHTAAHHSLNSHTSTIPESAFGSKEWVEFVERYLDRWKERTINWVLMNKRHPVHVVSYEDLQNDTVREVEKILDFLHFPYSHEDLIQRLRVDFNTFQRPHMNDGFQHFSPEQKERLRLTITQLMGAAKTAGKADLFLFSKYLADLPFVS